MIQQGKNYKTNANNRGTNAKLHAKQTRKVLRRFSVLALLFCVGLALPLVGQAAKLYFEPQEQVIGTEGEFSVAVKIDAENRINTISAALRVSKNLVPFDVNDGNSIINFWLDKPHFDEAGRLLTFSGIIPGGFQGEKAPLLILKFRTAAEKGIARLDFDREKTKVYLHTAEGLEDILILEKLELLIVKGKENIGVEAVDSDRPESFKPEIARDPSVFDNKWFLVFATQDKGLGISHYEILEKREYRIQNLEFGKNRPKSYILNPKSWTRAESPYLLKDQKLRSYVYVKAIDKAGNERIAVVSPKYPLKWYEARWVWGIIILVIIVLYIIGKILWKRVIH